MSSALHEEHKKHSFDSYCKKILKNEAVNIQKQLQRLSTYQKFEQPLKAVQVNS